jgi:hypothetical protein
MQTIASMSPSAADHVAAPGHTSKIEALGIVMPVGNGVTAVSQSIHQIFAANSRSGWRTAIWLVVVADMCTDDTARVARRLVGSFGEVLEVRAHSEDDARRVGAAAVFEHFHRKPRHTIALTYARPGVDLPEEWIDHLLTAEWPRNFTR